MDIHYRKKAKFHSIAKDKRKHPLHLSINVSNAEKLNVFEETCFFISVSARRRNDHDDNDSSIGSLPVTPSTDDQPTSNDRPSLQCSTSCYEEYHMELTNLCCNTEWMNIVCCVMVKDTNLEIEETCSCSSEVDLSLSSSFNPVRDKICLMGTEEFLLHYQINKNDDLFIRKMNLFPLNKVVIGVYRHETYFWIQSMKEFKHLKHSPFCLGLLTKVKQFPVVAREKDVFLAPYPIDNEGKSSENEKFDPSFFMDMHVLECCPLRVGILTEKTEFIISHIDETPSLQLPTLASPVKAMTSKSLDKYLISDFGDKIPRVNALASNARQLGVRSRPMLDRNNLSFHYQILQQNILWRRLLVKPQKVVTFDPLYVIGMTKNTMLEYGIFEESLVKVSLPEDSPCKQTSFPKTKRLCLIKCITESIDYTEKIFISPILLFNLQMTLKDPHRTAYIGPLQIEKYNVAEDDDVDTGITSSCWSSRIPVATEVQISIVRSPTYEQRSFNNVAIESYFKVPRLLTEGDLIPVKSSDDPNFKTSRNECASEKRYPIVFFKVVKVIGPKAPIACYLVDCNSTKLSEIGSVHSYVPVTALSYLSKAPLTYWDQTHLFGLNDYADKLENFIRPLLGNVLDDPLLKDVFRSIMLIGPSGCGKTTIATTVARRLNLHLYKVNCHRIYGDSTNVIETRMKTIFQKASAFSPCVLYLHSIHALGKDKERNTDDPRTSGTFYQIMMQQRKELLEFPVIVIGSTQSVNMLAPDVRESFLHEIVIDSLTEEERAEMLDGLLQNVNYSGDLSGQYLAQRTAGFVLGDMAALISHAKRDAYNKVLEVCRGSKSHLSYNEEEDIAMAGIVVQQQNFVAALDNLQSTHSDTIGAPKIPNVFWQDVGGLEDVKDEILDTIQLPLQFPELLAAGLRRSGVLLYGPPGTGKTLLAKAVATECSLNFLSVKGPELINMYVGQSEQNIRDVFVRARSATPCVIFFDELDSLAPNRGNSGDSGGVMDRVVSQLLAELDGLHKSCDVFVIGATNRPDLLDTALLRPGRFDKLLYLGVNNSIESKMAVLTALTRKFKLSRGVEMQSVAEKLPKTLTGADIYAVCSDALLNAIKRKIKELENGAKNEKDVLVSEEDFVHAIDKLVPSVSEEELLRYELLKLQFEKQKPTDENTDENSEPQEIHEHVHDKCCSE